MTLGEFQDGFLSIAAKPKREEWHLKVIEEKTSKVLMNDSIGDSRHAYPGTRDREVIKWWIEYRTFYACVKRKEEDTQ